jgi:hypothetical protein
MFQRIERERGEEREREIERKRKRTLLETHLKKYMNEL